MRRDTIIRILAAAVMLLCIGASATLATSISASSGRNRLVYADAAEGSDPPQVALGIAMGAFRGLFVNMLWIRANNLKEQGKYYEAVDLASTITKLQPRFPKVWAFHAWNLAYNISVATSTPEERWQWVQSGIRLLRNEGIPSNPTDLAIHRELAWIYLHKVQGTMDDANRYYKRAHAYEWTTVMGKPPALPVVSRSFEETTNLYVERWLKPIADAPDSLDELYAKYPLSRELVERLRTEADLSPDKTFLERRELLAAAVTSSQSLKVANPAAADPLLPILGDPKYAEFVRPFTAYVRKKVLRDEYKMEPGRMIRYTQEYGPLDWRHPAAHAVYWSARGVEESLLRINDRNRADFDILNADRLTIQSVQELFRSGLVVYDILNPDFYFALPQADFIPTYGKIIDELNEREEEEFLKTKRANIKGRIYRFYSAGHENFLRDAIRYLFRRGDESLAEEYYSELRTYEKQNTNNPYRIEELSVPLREFVINEIVNEDRFTSPYVALGEIYGALYAAYLQGLLAGNDTIFNTNLDYARRFHLKYNSEQKFVTAVNRDDQARMAMLPFDLMAANLLASLIQQASLPSGPLMYQRAPEELRGRTYAMLESTALKARIDEAAENGGTAFNVFFPPPADPEPYRQWLKNVLPGRSGSSGTIEMK